MVASLGADERPEDRGRAGSLIRAWRADPAVSPIVGGSRSWAAACAAGARLAHRRTGSEAGRESHALAPFARFGDPLSGSCVGDGADRCRSVLEAFTCACAGSQVPVLDLARASRRPGSPCPRSGRRLADADPDCDALALRAANRPARAHLRAVARMGRGVVDRVERNACVRGRRDPDAQRAGERDDQGDGHDDDRRREPPDDVVLWSASLGRLGVCAAGGALSARRGPGDAAWRASCRGG